MTPTMKPNTKPNAQPNAQPNACLTASKPAAVKQMEIGLLVIALQFLVPAVSYIVDPAGAVTTLSRVDVALGGAGLPAESGAMWHMLAVGNVMTLAFMCLLIRSNVERFLPALPALVFLKGFSSLYSLCIAVAHDVPAFAAVFVLDGVTTVAMAVLAMRAAHALARDKTAPWWARWLLINPERIEASLEKLGVDAPTLWQIFLGAVRMWHRILFRSETIGTSRAPVRNTWRARALAFRAVRLPFLVAERAVSPLDPSGLMASPERITHHLLAAHHEGHQLVYDIELMRLQTGSLAELRAAAASVVDGTHPRAEWLRDLCVHEGYHEALLAAVDDAVAGRVVDDGDPDITLHAFLAWCRAQPRSFGATSAYDATQQIAEIGGA